MGYSVQIEEKAHKELAGLERITALRIAKAVDQLQDLGLDSSQLKKLKTPHIGYRKKVGQYRILFDIEDQYITIYKIKHRKDAYQSH